MDRIAGAGHSIRSGLRRLWSALRVATDGGTIVSDVVPAQVSSNAPGIDDTRPKKTAEAY